MAGFPHHHRNHRTWRILLHLRIIEDEVSNCWFNLPRFGGGVPVTCDIVMKALGHFCVCSNRVFFSQPSLHEIVPQAVYMTFFT